MRGLLLKTDEQNTRVDQQKTKWVCGAFEILLPDIWGGTPKKEIYLLKIVYSFFKILFIFREREQMREKEGEKHWCARDTSFGCLLHAPNWGPCRQPRHVPWLGIKPATLWFTSQHSIHWATPARAEGIDSEVRRMRGFRIQDMLQWSNRNWADLIFFRNPLPPQLHKPPTLLEWKWNSDTAGEISYQPTNLKIYMHLFP